MAVYDNSYSRIVAWLKVIMPLLALAILSTLFLVSRKIDRTVSTLVTELPVQNPNNAQRAAKLLYSGVTTTGITVTLNAADATSMPGKNLRVKLGDIFGTFEQKDGQMVNLDAANGVFDAETNVGVLESGVTIRTPGGYRIETDTLVAELSLGRLSAPETVNAWGPLGSISAGSMVLQQQFDTGTSESYVLVFKDGVHLLYDPKQ